MGNGRHLRITESSGSGTKRRRLWLLPLLTGLVVAYGMTALASHDGTNTEVDLTSLDASETLTDGVTVTQTSFDESTGTGVFDSFVRVQATGTERGYNTSGTREFDELGSGFTRDLLLSEIPLVEADMRELRLDINQSSNSSLLSLDRIRIFVHDQASFSGADVNAADFGITGAELVWEMEEDHHILLEYALAPGSGRGDMFLYVPDSLFQDAAADAGCGTDCFVTLYSEFGAENPSNDGFEEWSVRKEAGEVAASKTADTSFTRTFPWTIDKTVTPEDWDLFEGDSGTSEYTVTLTKGDPVDSDFAVEGSLVFVNDTSENVRVTDVSDVIDGVGGPTIECPDTPGTEDADVGPQETFVCTYSADLPDSSQRLNTVTFTYQTLNPAGNPTGQPLTVEATELIQFDLETPTTVVNDSVNVTDSVEGDLGVFGDSNTATYTRTFTCDDDEGTHDNTATIVETDQSDDASVTVNCHALDVSKDAATSLTRTWTWDIDKDADQTELLLSDGQLFEDVNYSIVVSATSADSEWAVSGDITIENNTPIDAEIVDVWDLVSPGDISAEVTCDGETVDAAWSYDLAAGADLDCTYTASLPDASGGSNEAAAVIQNYSYDEEGVATAGGTTEFSSGDVDFDFADPTVNHVDECVSVTDDAGTPEDESDDIPLGAVCAGDLDGNGEYEITYSLSFGANPDADVILECGENNYTNTASFLTEDTETTGEDDHTVTATVNCVQGCTLTPGYWKTHNSSFWGGAPVDDTWDQLPDAELTVFFLSGQNYFDVLWSPPQGNAYYNLSFHYIAAELNQLNGADIPTDVLDAFDEATELFETYTPDEIADMKGKDGKELRQQFISLAGTLGAYNEGLLGPGHCDEDGSSDA